MTTPSSLSDLLKQRCESAMEAVEHQLTTDIFGLEQYLTWWESQPRWWRIRYRLCEWLCQRLGMTIFVEGARVLTDQRLSGQTTQLYAMDKHATMEIPL